MKTITPLIINGEAVHASKTFDVINPATGARFATVADGDVSHLDAAIASARAAFPSWASTADRERQSLIHAIGDALEENMQALMEFVTRETREAIEGSQRSRCRNGSRRCDRLDSCYRRSHVVRWTSTRASSLS